MNPIKNFIECDVLIVGGGLAAAAAMKYAHDKDVRVCQVVKGAYGLIGQRGAGASSCGASESGSPRLAKASIAAEDLSALFDMIIQAGLGMADRNLVTAMVSDFPKIQQLLEKWDIRFDRGGPYHLGYPFVNAVEPDVRSSGIRIFEHFMISDLLVHNGACAGAVGVGQDGEICLFKSSAVILATGGDAHLFKHNVHPDCVTGDGYAMGFRAGAELMNMEFMQIFFCTVHPTRNLFHAWHKDALRNIRNTEGDLILPKYLPSGISLDQCLEENHRHAPFSTRDPASRYLGIAMVKEVQAGRGTEHGGVFIDVRDSIDVIPENQKRFLKQRGIDVSASPVQVTMGHQCSNGGLRIDTDAMTAVPGVFSAGETVTGMHGADRLGGNMLSACLVFGIRAAESAVRWAKENPADTDIEPAAREKIEPIQALRSCSGKASPKTLIAELQDAAWNHGLTVRSEESLNLLLADIGRLRDAVPHGLSVNDPNDLVAALELRNLLIVGELVAKASLERNESRGGHYREDYPDCNYRDPAQAIVLKRAEDGSIRIEKTVADPLWRFDAQGLGSGRWG
jgi:succinate dehydrogenase/fumarate reductase flavoprotein subunit